MCERHAADGGSPYVLEGGAAMMEDLFFIQREISVYRAMLKLYMGAESRATLMQLLAEAEHKLAVATDRELQRH